MIVLYLLTFPIFKKLPWTFHSSNLRLLLVRSSIHQDPILQQISSESEYRSLSSSQDSARSSSSYGEVWCSYSQEAKMRRWSPRSTLSAMPWSVSSWLWLLYSSHRRYLRCSDSGHISISLHRTYSIRSRFSWIRYSEEGVIPISMGHRIPPCQLDSQTYNTKITKKSLLKWGSFCIIQQNIKKYWQVTESRIIDRYKLTIFLWIQL